METTKPTPILARGKKPLYSRKIDQMILLVQHPRDTKTKACERLGEHLGLSGNSVMKLAGGGYAGRKTITHIFKLHRELSNPQRAQQLRDEARITVRFSSQAKKRRTDILTPAEKANALIKAADAKRKRAGR